MKDAHDPRDFRVWVTLNDSGAVAATHAFEASVEDPGDQFIEVTSLGLVDVSHAVIDPQLAIDRLAKKDAVLQAQLALAEARGAVVTATAQVTAALAVAAGTP